MKQPKRLTRAEKIALVAAAKRGETITDPRVFKVLPPGLYNSLAFPDVVGYDYGTKSGRWKEDDGTDIRGVGTGREA